MTLSNGQVTGTAKALEAVCPKCRKPFEWRPAVGAFLAFAVCCEKVTALYQEHVRVFYGDPKAWDELTAKMAGAGRA